MPARVKGVNVSAAVSLLASATVWTLGAPDAAAQGGWFGEATWIPVDSQPYTMDVGQLVGDERLDVVVGTRQGQILVFENTGVGTGLRLDSEFQVIGEFASVTVGNYLGGEENEIAVAFNSFQAQDSVVVWKDDGAGFVRASGLLSPFTISTSGSGDANGDSYDDIVVTGPTSFVDLFLGGSSTMSYGGTFTVRVHPACGIPESNINTSVLLEDLNGDLNDDVVIAAFNDDPACSPSWRGVGAFYGDGTGDFGLIDWVVRETYDDSPFTRLVTGDFNDDAVVDLAIGSTLLHMYVGPEWVEEPEFDPGISPREFAFLDLNGDSILDLVGGNAGWFFVAQGQGEMSFDVLGYSNAGVAGITLLDVDGYEGLDVVGGEIDKAVTIHQNLLYLDPAGLSEPEPTATPPFAQNPIQGGRLKLSFASLEQGPATAALIDPGGRVVASFPLMVSEGNNDEEVDVGLGVSGSFLLRLSLPSGRVLTQRLISFGR